MSLGVEILDNKRGIIQPTFPGNSVLFFDRTVPQSSETYNVSDDQISIMKIDPILTSLRLDLTANQAATRLDSTVVSLEILTGLFFHEERSEVTLSVILENGRRFVITEPSEIQLQSSNSSILSVDGSFVVAEEVGSVELNVTWIVCDVILGTSMIDVTVEFSDNRPVFEENPQSAGVVENSPLGTPVATVFADDLDFAPGTDLERRDTEYRFVDDSFTHEGLFSLDKFTGVISLNGPLDRETRDSYVVLIEATDRAQRQQEQQGSDDSGGVDSSRSGTGSDSESEDILMPDEEEDTPTPLVPLRIDVVTVSEWLQVNRAEHVASTKSSCSTKTVIHSWQP